MVDIQKNVLIVFEDLPNELLSQILSYLSGVDAVFGFSLLNRRFQCLLKEYCLGFDFQLTNKRKFDIIFNQYDKQWWKSLKLSNEDTPGQIEYFFQCYSLIDEISQLKSLCLLKIELINKSILLSQISFLTNLISLTLKPICGRIIFNIDLPKLKRLVVTSCQNTEWIRIFRQLESVEYELITCCSTRRNFIWPQQLKHLKIILKNDRDCVLIPQSLKHLSQLLTLEIYQKEFGRSFINGQIWRNLIHSSFPLMKKFQFYFPFYLNYLSNIEIENLISTYSTSFYIDEKRKWFIRCDISTDYGRGIIYSLPFGFDQFIVFNDLYKSKVFTFSNNINKKSKKNFYKNIKIFTIESLPSWTIDWKLCSKLDQNFDREPIPYLMYNNYFNSVERFHFSNETAFLHRARHHVDALSKNFFNLIKKMPRLYSLDICINDLQIVTKNFNGPFICDYLSKQICSLKLYQNKRSTKQYLTEQEINRIISIFGGKCQHLVISIPSSIDTVMTFLQNMQQLHSLHTVIETKNNPEITKDWFLKQQLIAFDFSNCFIFNHHYDFYFWLTR